MKALGLDISKEVVSWVTVELAKGQVYYRDHGIERFSLVTPTPKLMAHFEGIFRNLLETHKPEIIGYKTTLNANKITQIKYLLYPLGVLNRIVVDQPCEIKEFHSGSFTSKRLNYPKAMTKEDACDRQFGKNTPNWAKCRSAALAAWSAICST